MEVPHELHRRPTLSHFMSRVESSNLRDLLKVRQDDAEAAARARRRGSAEATRTLATILACEKRNLSDPSTSSSSSVSSVVTRTLLDIIRDEQEPHRILADGGSEGVVGGGVAGGNRGAVGAVNWKALRDRLRLRRASEGLSAFGVANQLPREEEGGGSSHQPVVSAGGPRPLVSILEAAEPLAPDRGATTTTGDAASSSSPSQEESRVNGRPTASSNRPQPQATHSRQQPGPPQDEPAAPSNRPQPPQDETSPPSNRPQHPPSRSRQQPPQDERATSSNLPQAPAPQPSQDEPTRVSLMALLEQADRTGGVGGPSFAAAVVGLVDADGHGDEEENHRTAVAGGGDESLCCVCMVRHKGAAFIPCGHTFCRLCTRELWVTRGTCPLCNGFIIEILDIF